MRLTPEQTKTIVTLVRAETTPDARIVLFGSRLDDSRLGGDIDLLIESRTPPTLMQRARLKCALENTLLLPVDIIAKQTAAPATAFQSIALATGIALN